jgi:3-hydroxyisobutyrate dehydrogenase-like beta-hydroxyacid dehydrogenase
MAKERIGFIGVGRMGDPMARNLLAAGFELTIYDTSAAALEPLKALGAQVAKSPIEVASAAEIVLVSLPTPAIVKKVALEISSAPPSGSKMKIFIDVSTTGPKVAGEIASALAAKGITAVDAPVSGGVGGARKGTLAVMLACPSNLVERVRPVLEPIGKIFFLGERPGSGQLMKLANNMLSAAALAVTSEVMVMGAKGGLDPHVMLDVINSGTGRNSASVDKFPKAILPRTFDFGFAIGLLLKDVKLCTDEAAGLGVPMICGNAIRELLAITALRQGSDADFTTIVKTVEEWAGVEVKG